MAKKEKEAAAAHAAPVTVGRSVHYFPLTGELVPRAATVTAVRVVGDPDDDPDAPIDRAVSLAVFYTNRMEFLIDVSFADEPTPGCWSWPARVG